MIATHSEYETMQAVVSRLIQAGTSANPEECEELGIDFDAVSSLYNQAAVRHLKREAKKGVDGFLSAEFSSFENSKLEVLPSVLAAKFKIGGYKLARIYLEWRYGKSASLAHFLDNPSLVNDVAVREDLLACMASDPFSSHPCEQLKECVGKEYEEYLITRLTEKRLCFETEAELRSRGKPKTPDVLFLIPQATPHCNDPAKGLTVVNWIDSKAMFADEDTLAEHLEQLRGYSNRYGRGLVIYWHGYVSDITSSRAFQATDDMIMISNKFPETWSGLYTE